jgi:ubiquinone/menaquinone biosynthesis C-methylase UbiE
MIVPSARKAKPYKGVNMEGPLATWYAKNTASSLGQFRSLAAEIAASLDPGDWVLEVAPGPGYLAAELARLGLTVTGLDVSHSFVRIAADHASKLGVTAEFVQGDAAHAPFEDERLDYVVCRAAFKNFSDPVGALKEMRRVLRRGGRARLIDMSREASDADIDSEVAGMRLPALDAWFTRGALRSLRGRAYPLAEFQRMTVAAGFADVRIATGALGVDIVMTR